MEWKPEPEIIFGAILAKNQISGFLGLVSRWYVYVRPRRDRPIDQLTGNALDRRRGPETELLRPGEPTPITLIVDGDDIVDDVDNWLLFLSLSVYIKEVIYTSET